MTTISSSSTGIILSPQNPDVTITGVITGNLPAGQGAYAAIQGGATTNFNILNLGTVESLGAEPLNAGLFLADPGIITNKGTIEGQSGLLVFSASPGAYVRNTGLIEARSGYGVYLQAAGGVSNAGVISGGAYGIYLGGGGAAANSGTIAGAYGIYTAGSTQMDNSGLIRATKYAAAVIDGVLTNEAAGVITGPTGVALPANSSVINYGGIQGGTTGIAGNASAAIYNYGVITGATAVASAGAYSYNDGTIAGTQTGIQLSSRAVLINAGPGIISGDTGATLGAGAKLFNYASVKGANIGVIGQASAAVYNYGVITGLTAVSHAGAYTYNSGTIAGSQTGIQLGTQAYLINTSSGTIAGATAISVANAVTFYNYGRVAGAITGLGAGAQLYNYAGGVITAASDAISLSAGANVYNAGVIIGGATAIAVAGGVIADYGTIAGTQAAIAAGTTSNATLILAPAAVVSGGVYLGGGALQLLAGARPGTISTTQFSGMDEITLATGAVWSLSGAFNEAVIADNGLLETAPSDTLSVFVLSGTGTLDMPDNLAITGLATTGETIVFTGTADSLQITSPEIFGATIQNFAAGDIIDLTTLAFSAITGETFGGGFLTFAESAASQTFAIELAPGQSGALQLFADGAGTGITLSPSSPALLQAAQGWPSPSATSLAFAPVVTNSFGS